MDNTLQEHFKEKLLTERKELMKSRNNLNQQEKESLKDSTGELSSYDNHPADQATNTYEREKDIGLLDNTMETIKQIDSALQLMNSNDYGFCQNCGKEINLERLETVPHTVYCRKCGTEHERSGGDN